jgi:hypothetical protein
MRFADIQSALFASWATGAYGLTTYYPNRDYNPAAGDDHARLFVLWGGSDAATMGSDGTNEVTGIFQIDLMFRTGRGDGEALEMIDTICADYISGTRLNYNSQQVVIWGATPTTLATENGWLRSVLTINFSAYVRRA